jgi:hypothetical protein
VIGRYDNGLSFSSNGASAGSVLFLHHWHPVALEHAGHVGQMCCSIEPSARCSIKHYRDAIFATTEPVMLPLRPPAGGSYLQLVHPDGRHEPVMVDALGEDQYALVLRDLPERGTYRITAREADAAAEGSVTEKTLWTLPIAVAGPEAESRLAALPRDDAMAGVDAARVRWLGHNEEIGTAGATVRGQYLWKWLMAAVLVGSF